MRKIGTHSIGLRFYILATVSCLLLPGSVALGEEKKKAATTPQQSAKKQQEELYSDELSERLPQKLAILEAKVQAAQQSGKDLGEVAKTMQEFDKLMQGGKPEEAEKVMDKALALLADAKAEANTVRPPNSATKPPPLALQRKMNKIQNFFELVQKNMSQVPELMQSGKMEEAQKTMEKTLALLGEKPKKGFETLGPSPQEIEESMQKIQSVLHPLAQEMQKIPSLFESGKVEQAELEADNILKKIEKLNPKAFAELKDTPSSNQGSAKPMSESLQKKVKLVQKGIQARQAEGKDLSDIGQQMQHLGSLMQKGEMKEAEALLDEVLKKLDPKK